PTFFDPIYGYNNPVRTANWQQLNVANANGTNTHNNSRDIVVDYTGEMLQANDGGLFRFVGAGTAADKGASNNGHLAALEMLSAGYDPINDILFGGTSGNGTAEQTTANGAVWDQYFGGDGNAFQAVNLSASPGHTLRYTMADNYGGSTGPATSRLLRRE